MNVTDIKVTTISLHCRSTKMKLCIFQFPLFHEVVSPVLRIYIRSHTVDSIHVIVAADNVVK
jgi:hypothetical protein